MFVYNGLKIWPKNCRKYEYLFYCLYLKHYLEISLAKSFFWNIDASSEYFSCLLPTYRLKFLGIYSPETKSSCEILKTEEHHTDQIEEQKISPRVINVRQNFKLNYKIGKAVFALITDSLSY